MENSGFPIFRKMIIIKVAKYVATEICTIIKYVRGYFLRFEI